MKNQTSQNFTMVEEGADLSLLWLHSKPLPHHIPTTNIGIVPIAPESIQLRSCIVHSAFRIVYMSGTLDWPAFQVG
jgi:hypothetical protein